MNICVYCGSSSGKDSIYREQAQQLGLALVNRKHDLIYGGASIGLMGKLADTLLEYDRQVIGVIPDNLMKQEVAHDKLTELLVTETMHERKALMAKYADAFLAMPGGFGTLEEIFETITWAQLDIHQKPLILLNINGYFDSLRGFINMCVDEGFIHPSNQSLFRIEKDIEVALDWLETHMKEQPAEEHYERT